MRAVRWTTVVVAPLYASVGLLAQDSRSAPMLFGGARIIDGNGGAPIENGALLVQDGRVAAVGARGAVAAPAGAVRVDVTGKTIMPAMINAHVHMRGA